MKELRKTLGRRMTDFIDAIYVKSSKSNSTELLSSMFKDEILEMLERSNNK